MLRDLLLDPDMKYAIHRGDCIEHLATLPGMVFDLAVFSPPFPSVYAYTSQGCDLGNSEDLKREGKIHLSFFYKQLVRVMKPGRIVVVHVQQVPRMKRAKGRGIIDFRGLNIRVAERAGLIFEYDWLIRKNPQAQAIRTKSHNLQFAGLERDRAGARGALCDYLLKFSAPGDNARPIDSEDEVSRNDWIKLAEGAWFDIRETDTLNARDAKGEEDVKHICALQLEVIDRIVKLYSNPGELVFSPFAGIGSEGFVSIKRGRRFFGCEIKAEYHAAALRNLERAEREAQRISQPSLFANVE